MNATQRVLSDALELMRTKGWTSGRCSLDAAGNKCASGSDCVAKVSVCGSVVISARGSVAAAALDQLREAGDCTPVSSYASSLSTFAEVEAWFARAIELAGKDGE